MRHKEKPLIEGVKALDSRPDVDMVRSLRSFFLNGQMALVGEKELNRSSDD